jgi:site-specific DNA-methyltransferase (adenine-specific)
VKTYTNENDIVLDNAAGSFTTFVACDNLKRSCIGIEKIDEFCQKGKDRINENRNRLIQDGYQFDYQTVEIIDKYIVEN